ncbi:MAG: hypothetical protein NC905_04860 [Candidatus Omnitrophica bacterium]|nr:hypothetical protein [Candidatus Omnitrophota bacterium]
MNNLKQLGLALVMYADNNNGRIPRPYMSGVRWYWLLGSQGYLPGLPGDPNSTPTVAECPSQGTKRHYGLNQNQDSPSMDTEEKRNKHYNMRRWVNPSLKVLAGDTSRWDAIGANDEWRWDFKLDEGVSDNDYLNPRHNMGANILWADFHVSWVSVAEKPQGLYEPTAWRLAE